MTDYQPVDCGLHDEFELAVMRARKLRLKWRDTAGTRHIDLLTPRDLLVRDAEEFLLATTTAGEALEIRLDRIDGFESA